MRNMMAIVLITFIPCMVHAEQNGITRLPAPGGEVVLLNAHERDVMHQQLTYAATRRAGDFVYLSGLEIGPEEDEGHDINSFKEQVRRGLTHLGARLEAVNASYQHVVQIQSFHNCDTEYFEGDFNDQLTAIVEVKHEFMKPPYSTWTAICVNGHYSENTVVEIQLTAYAPIN